MVDVYNFSKPKTGLTPNIARKKNNAKTQHINNKKYTGTKSTHTNLPYPPHMNWISIRPSSARINEYPPTLHLQLNITLGPHKS